MRPVRKKRLFWIIACKPGITKQILSMTINGSGIRDIARVLRISKTTVLDKLKKSKVIE
jgi:transposase-like protein